MRQLHQRVFVTVIAGFFFILIAHAQTNSVGIGTPFRTGKPNSKAVLHLDADPSQPQGFLMPRLDRTKFVGLSSAENGLIVYDRIDNQFYYWLTDKWIPIGQGSNSHESWLSGEGLPDNAIGIEGDFYFDSASNTLYRKDSFNVYKVLFMLGGYVAGEGISIVNGVIKNTGDSNADDDITTNTVAGGDLTGTYPNLTLALRSVTAEKIAPAATGNMQLITNGSGVVQWVPTSTASVGLGEIAIGNGTGINNVVVSQDATLAVDGKLTVTGLLGKPLNTGVDPYINQVLTWNGSIWTYAYIGAIADVNGDVIGNLSDTKVKALQNYPVADVMPSAGNILQWNGSEWIPASAMLSGDANGEITDITVSRIQNRDISNSTPVNGQVLTWNSFLNKWEPASIPATPLPNTANGALLVGNGSSINSVTLNQDVTLTSTGKATVVGLQGKTISTVAPISGQILGWNNTTSKWEPQNRLSSGDLNATTNVIERFQGNPVAATSPTTGQTLIYNGTQWVNGNPTANGDVSGSLTNLTVTKLQNRSIDASAPMNIGDVLTWNGSQWTPKSIPAFTLPNTTSGSLLIGNGSTVNSVTMSQDVVLANNGKATVTGLQGKQIDGSAASLGSGDNGKVLTWDGSVNKWAPRNITASGLLEAQSYSIPQLRYYSIDPTEFVEVNTSSAKLIFEGIRGNEIDPGSGSSTYMVAPLHLPHGATLTEITYLCFDNHSSKNISFYYTRNDLAGNAADIGTASSSGSAGNQSVIYSTSDVVDNQAYSYKVVAVLNDNSQRIYGIRIKYTVTKPD